ncbi:hypothetical protein AB0H71_01950 [Nocardia sp. NPDC050697]
MSRHGAASAGEPRDGESEQPLESVGMDMIRVGEGRLVEHWMVAEPFGE